MVRHAEAVLSTGPALMLQWLFRYLFSKSTHFFFLTIVSVPITPRVSHTFLIAISSTVRLSGFSSKNIFGNIAFSKGYILALIFSLKFDCVGAWIAELSFIY